MAIQQATTTNTLKPGHILTSGGVCATLEVQLGGGLAVVPVPAHFVAGCQRWGHASWQGAQHVVGQRHCDGGTRLNLQQQQAAAAAAGAAAGSSSRSSSGSSKRKLVGGCQ
jgi:hypothetical protein